MLIIVQAPNQPLRELLIYFNQEGVDSTIVFKPSQPQAKPQLQDTEVLVEILINLTHGKSKATIQPEGVDKTLRIKITYK